MFLVCGVSFVALALFFFESAAVTKCRSSPNFVHCGAWSVDRIVRTFATFADHSALHQSKLEEQKNMAVKDGIAFCKHMVGLLCLHTLCKGSN